MSTAYVTQEELQATEGRIIKRIDEMDRRINGRIKGIEVWKDRVNDWWQQHIGASDLIRGKNWNPIVVGAVICVISASLTLAGQRAVGLNKKTSALCQTKTASLKQAFDRGTYTFAEYSDQLDILYAQDCK